jgi:PhzF family phenazine biosynthesis protein
MTPIKIYQVDSFTAVPFKGNPAAVCILDEDIDERLMQTLAGEMNLSETAFVLRKESSFGLRWFTPKTEVDLCGHATIATSHILWEQGYVPPAQQIRFETKSGTLIAKKNGDFIELDFPHVDQHTEIPPSDLISGIGVDPVYVGASEHYYLVELASEKLVRDLKPNLDCFRKLEKGAILVTSKSSMPQYDFVSRVFCPLEGIDEDPVTGAAHCILAPYWKDKLGKDSFTAYQASERGGEVRVSLEGDRIILSGQAITVFAGEIVDRLLTLY